MEPEEVAKKPYALLARVLEERHLLAIGRLAMRSRERLCALRPRDGGIIQLETLYSADEVRAPEFDVPETQAAEAEMKVANALVDLLTEPFDPAKYRDEYRDTLLGLITAKLEGHELVTAPEPGVAKPAVDLMAALRASVDAAKDKKEGKPRASARGSKAKAAAATEAEPAEAPAPARRREGAAAKS